MEKITAQISIDGRNFVDLPYDQIDEYKNDPVGFVAKRLAVSKETYQEWLQIPNNPDLLRCHGKTRSGSRCLSALSSGQPTLHEFEKLRGGYCRIHGG